MIRSLNVRQLIALRYGSVFGLAVAAALLGSTSLLATVTGTSFVTTIAGTGVQGFAGDGGPATAAEITTPRAVAADRDGSVYVSDGLSRVRRIDGTTGIITTVAGTATAGFAGDGGLAINAMLNRPIGLVLDSAGNLYIGDTNNNRVRRVEVLTGIITTIAGSGALESPLGDGGRHQVAGGARVRRRRQPADRRRWTRALG